MVELLVRLKQGYEIFRQDTGTSCQLQTRGAMAREVEVELQIVESEKHFHVMLVWEWGVLDKKKARAMVQ